jgi:hypothetical protein
LPDWTIEREWDGETAAILASGPSMTREQAEAVRHLKTIAVNNQGIDTMSDRKLVPAFAPWADILYAADAKWWKFNRSALEFAGRKVTIRTSQYDEVYALKQSPELVYDPRPTHIVSGGNSSYQAVQIAAKLGAKRILLLGVDMTVHRNRLHWFGNHPHELHTVPLFKSWIKAFGRMAPVLERMGVEVVNCSPITALECFRRAPLESALRG